MNRGGGRPSLGQSRRLTPAGAQDTAPIWWLLSSGVDLSRQPRGPVRSTELCEPPLRAAVSGGRMQARQREARGSLRAPAAQASAHTGSRCPLPGAHTGQCSWAQENVFVLEGGM